MHVDEFAPEIESVDALTDGEDRVGSRRRNHFKNGTSLVEEIVELNADRWQCRVRLSEMASMPLREAESEMYVEETDPGQSKVVWTMEYRVKFGPVGWLLGQTAMKMMMGKILDGNLKGLAGKVESRQAAEPG